MRWQSWIFSIITPVTSVSVTWSFRNQSNMPLCFLLNRKQEAKKKLYYSIVYLSAWMHVVKKYITVGCCFLFKFKFAFLCGLLVPCAWKFLHSDWLITRSCNYCVLCRQHGWYVVNSHFLYSSSTKLMVYYYSVGKLWGGTRKCGLFRCPERVG